MFLLESYNEPLKSKDILFRAIYSIKVQSMQNWQNSHKMNIFPIHEIHVVEGPPVFSLWQKPYAFVFCKNDNSFTFKWKLFKGKYELLHAYITSFCNLHSSKSILLTTVTFQNLLNRTCKWKIYSTMNKMENYILPCR